MSLATAPCFGKDGLLRVSASTSPRPNAFATTTGSTPQKSGKALRLCAAEESRSRFREPTELAFPRQCTGSWNWRDDALPCVDSPAPPEFATAAPVLR